MSKENVQVFFKMVETDETLRASYQTFLKGMAEAQLNEQDALPEVVKFAGQHGIQFSAEDLALVASEMQNGDLTEEQLTGVTGGALGWFFVSGGSFETYHGQVCFIAGYAC